jgi:hypothetical protein
MPAYIAILLLNIIINKKGAIAQSVEHTTHNSTVKRSSRFGPRYYNNNNKIY